MRYLFLILFMGLSACATFTTPLRDCKLMCGSNKAVVYESHADGEKCQCEEGKNGAIINH